MVKPNTLDFVWTDNAGKPATAGYHVDPALTKDNYNDAGRALALLLDPISNGILQSGSFSVPLDVSALTSNLADPGSDVEEIGELLMTSLAGEPVSINIPGISVLTFIPGSNVLDVAEVNLAALINALENGIAVTLATIAPTDIDESDILSVDTARKKIRPSGTRGK